MGFICLSAEIDAFRSRKQKEKAGTPLPATPGPKRKPLGTQKKKDKNGNEIYELRVNEEPCQKYSPMLMMLMKMELCFCVFYGGMARSSTRGRWRMTTRWITRLPSPL